MLAAALSGPLAAFGDAQARDVTPEAIQRLLVGHTGEGVATRHLANPKDGVQVRACESACRQEPGSSREDVAAGQGRADPALIDRRDRPRRWRGGRWGPMIVFMADSGARPAEAVALEWRHVDLERRTAELPGLKTEGAWRTVHLTCRGVRRCGRCRARSPRSASSTSTGARSHSTTSAGRFGPCARARRLRDARPVLPAP